MILRKRLFAVLAYPIFISLPEMFHAAFSSRDSQLLSGFKKAFDPGKSANDNPAFSVWKVRPGVVLDHN